MTAHPSSSDIVAAARGWLGTPYRHQASVKGVGCDCLGLVRGIWREFYGDEPEAVPNYSASWGEGKGVDVLSEVAEKHLVKCGFPSTGRVVIFRMRPNIIAKHCGIMIGNGKFIHSTEGHGVVEVHMVPWYSSRIVGSYAFPGVD